MPTLNLQVGRGAGDGTLRMDNGTNASLSLSQLDARCDASFLSAWHQLDLVTIPQGSTIDQAILSLFSSIDGQNILNGEFAIKCEDVDDSALITDGTGSEVYTRPFTSGIAIPAQAWAANGVYWTIDIAAEVQKIINRTGWASGNRMLVLFEALVSTGVTRCRARSYENPPGGAKLDIDYTVPVSIIKAPVVSAGRGGVVGLDGRVVGTGSPIISGG